VLDSWLTGEFLCSELEHAFSWFLLFFLMLIEACAQYTPTWEEIKQMLELITLKKYKFLTMLLFSLWFRQLDPFMTSLGQDSQV